MMHEIELHNKISKEIQDSLQRGYDRTKDQLVRKRIKTMIKKIQN
jgi:hypothetical protein